jgi:WD40 repeat protein
MTSNEDAWIDRLETNLNACSLETLYTPLKNNSYPIIIGCYQLNESTVEDQKPDHDVNHNLYKNDDNNVQICKEKTKASRSGELILYSINQELKFGKQRQGSLSADSGVLDGKWLQSGRLSFHTHDSHSDDKIKESHSSESYMYATANASGAINIYRLLDGCDGDDNLQLTHVRSSEVDDVDEIGLALSLAWDESLFSRNQAGVTSTRIVSSYSKGTLALHNVNVNVNTDIDVDTNSNSSALEIEETHRWNAHELFGYPSEVWTVCFASNRHYNTYADTVISGGDDCKMKLWDVRLCGISNPKPVTVKTGFEAGVTGVSYHPTLEHIFAVGSYDEEVRIYDMRKLSGEPLGKVNVGGGVWRIKWHPKDASRILVGAMHGGCRLVDVPNIELASPSSSISDHTECMMNIVKEFTEHKSMAYGADWVCGENGDFEAAASCSFYDCQAFIWD